jgi:hypothetical protein
MATIAQLRQATLDARKATGMQGIGTECSRGLYRVVHVTFAKGRTTVDPLSNFAGPDATIETLQAIAADAGCSNAK